MKAFLSLLFLLTLIKLDAQRLGTLDVINYLNSLSEKYLLRSDNKPSIGYKFYLGDNNFLSLERNLIYYSERDSNIDTIAIKAEAEVDTAIKQGGGTKLLVIEPIDTTWIDLETFRVLKRQIKRSNLSCYETLPFRDEKSLKPEMTRDYCRCGFDIEVPCSHSALLDIYEKGIQYLVSILADNTNKISIFNPFADPQKKVSSISIPLKRSGSNFMLAATINKQPIDFVLDTGASDCVLNEATFKRLFNASNHNLYIKIPDGIYKIANGSIIQQPRYKISGINLNGFKVDNVVITVIPNNVQNLLGNSFLGLFSSWKIDNEKNLLTINL